MLVKVFAVQRLTQLITQDEITRPLRMKVDKWAGDAPEFSLKERAAYMVECPACTSIWAALVVSMLSRFRLGRVAVRVLALSGMALLTDAVVERVALPEGG
jgi:hypothetical protein